MKEVQEPTVDAEFTEVEQEVKCFVTVGMDAEGKIFFDTGGFDQNLINIEGLLKYAERHMDRVWKDRLEQAE